MDCTIAPAAGQCAHVALPPARMPARRSAPPTTFADAYQAVICEAHAAGDMGQVRDLAADLLAYHVHLLEAIG